ncbi:hypothetical protein PPERSA_08803 [Pseudocohnilembus persalinus]|uniref:U1 small nuclear ribonucleoprotein C n=1 Tax=Pseudocohnilembus persalinus TaxID=266149 RepID=A0A0V0R3L1_PSEPJ|nr:hypothetical protein PPERSA_08803 [Pseudocohnilembus persalinus]|eukprot:KRX09087.1 hypothetical protein PPERSA_08803 [Pseudocohnilembus persalinus]
MPKYYCEYCGIYLTHSSPHGRGQHNHGRKHQLNRQDYYKQVIDDQNDALAEERQNNPQQMSQMQPQMMPNNMQQPPIFGGLPMPMGMPPMGMPPQFDPKQPMPQGMQLPPPGLGQYPRPPMMNNNMGQQQQHQQQQQQQTQAQAQQHFEKKSAFPQVPQKK